LRMGWVWGRWNSGVRVSSQKQYTDPLHPTPRRYLCAGKGGDTWVQDGVGAGQVELPAGRVWDIASEAAS
jgi:hypothetical protein